MVPSSDEIEAFALEQFCFPTSDIVEGIVVASDDGVGIPFSRDRFPKAVSPTQHRSKVGQPPTFSLKSLSDRVDAVAKGQQDLAFDQNKMMQLMVSMKIEMSSKFLAIMAILSDLQGSRDRRVEDQTEFYAKGKERAEEVVVDHMEVYN